MPTPNLTSLLIRTADAATLTFVALSSLPAMAQPTGSANPASHNTREFTTSSLQGVGVQLGYNSKYKKITLAYDTPSLWQYQLGNDWGRVSLDLELGVSYWKARHADPRSMWQLSAIPTLRWWPTESIYLEAGVGPSVLSRSQFAGYDLSTRFQFGSHMGVGVLIHDAHRLSLRYSHVSNANIKKPNPGLDLVQLSYTYMF